MQRKATGKCCVIAMRRENHDMHVRVPNILLASKTVLESYRLNRA